MEQGHRSPKMSRTAQGTGPAITHRVQELEGDEHPQDSKLHGLPPTAMPSALAKSVSQDVRTELLPDPPRKAVTQLRGYAGGDRAN